MDEEINPSDEFIISTIKRMPDVSLNVNCHLCTYQYGLQVLPFVVTGKTGKSVVIIPEDYSQKHRKGLERYHIPYIVTKTGMTSQELANLVSKKTRKSFWFAVCEWLLAN